MMKNSANALIGDKGFFILWACFFAPFLSATPGYSACTAPAKIVGHAYNSTSLQNAYDYASNDLGLSNFTLQIAGEILTEDLILDGGAVVLDGGYDCAFAVKDSETRLFGKITIASGSATIAGGLSAVSTDQCDFDRDNDGFTSIGSCSGSADDCNDNNISVNPGALEICGDGIDQDCNGADESCPATCEILFCPSSENCTAAGGFWWSDNRCMGVPESETVTSAGRVWMDRNLGASQVATSLTDSLAYGNYYQWGRGADGHQFPDSDITSTTSSSDDPGHGDFIITDTSPYDWRIPQNDNLWQGEAGVNNPCPAGFRVPTEAEWVTEMASWSSMDPAGAFASPLKLVVGGYHCHFCGGFLEVDVIGFYWSSTVYHASNGNHYSRNLHLGQSSTNMGFMDRAFGYNIRCIED